MIFFRTGLDDPKIDTDAVVVIDVCRAFTTAAFALDAGAEKILVVGTVAEAFQLKKQFPDALLVGEVNGLPVEGFDLWNSPSEILILNLSGKTLILRTTSGTQGVLAYKDSNNLLASAFVNASATSRYIQSLGIESVNFLMTGVRSGGGGGEDAACADYLAALMTGTQLPRAELLGWVKNWKTIKDQKMAGLDEILSRDVECCMQMDRFHFVMRAEKWEGNVILKPIPA